MSVTLLRQKRNFVIAAAIALATTTSALAAGAPIAVKKSAKAEVGPAAGDEWFAWSQSRESQASPFDLYAQRRSGGKAFRVNGKGTQAYAGGIDRFRLVYQLIRGQLADRSDLRLFNLERRRHKPLPAGINTKGWECCGTIFDDWLLFSRGHTYSGARQLVLLRNLVTGEQRVLDTLQNRKGLVSAGQIYGDWAVWARCNPYPSCQVFRYQVSTATATAVTVPPGKIPYAPAVNPYGTVYFFQSNNGCGRSVQLVKQTAGGPPEVLASLPTGRDVDVSYVHTISPKPPGEIVRSSIYYDQVVCSKRSKWDIYRVDDTDRLPPPG